MINLDLICLTWSLMHSGTYDAGNHNFHFEVRIWNSCPSWILFSIILCFSGISCSSYSLYWIPKPGLVILHHDIYITLRIEPTTRKQIDSLLSFEIPDRNESLLPEIFWIILGNYRSQTIGWVCILNGYCQNKILKHFEKTLNINVWISNR